MMDRLTVYEKNLPNNTNQFDIEINKKDTKLGDLSQLDELEIETSLFFGVDSCLEKNDKIIISYIVPNEYKRCDEAKDLPYLFRLELAYNLIKLNPLNDFYGKTFLDPNNVFFKTANEIKILYKSNGLLPYDLINPIDQYKNFLFGFLSDQNSYKKFLRHKEEVLKKENNNFFFMIHKTSEFSELMELIEKELMNEKTKFFIQAGKEDKNKRYKKIKLLSICCGTAIFVIVLAGLGIQNNKIKIEDKYSSKIEALENEKEMMQCLSTGDTEKAITTLKARGESDEDISKVLFNMGKYNEAIKFSSDIEPQVVKQLYKLNQKEKVLSLSSNSSFILMEKSILTDDLNTLYTKIPLIENKESLERLGDRFLENNLIDSAKRIETIIANNNFSNKVRKKSLEIEIEKDLHEITALKLQKNPLNEEKIKDLNKKISDKQKEIITLEEKIQNE